MPNIPFTEEWRKEYENLFNTCIIRTERSLLVDGIVKNLMANKNRYQRVSEAQGIPWSFVAAIHNMEANLNFTKHLHNGDPPFPGIFVKIDGVPGNRNSEAYQKVTGVFLPDDPRG